MHHKKDSFSDYLDSLLGPRWAPLVAPRTVNVIVFKL